MSFVSCASAQSKDTEYDFTGIEKADKADNEGWEPIPLHERVPLDKTLDRTLCDQDEWVAYTQSIRTGQYKNVKLCVQNYLDNTKK